MTWIDKASAVVLPWMPGEEGPTALARVLFGDTEPGGRLPLPCSLFLDEFASKQSAETRAAA